MPVTEVSPADRVALFSEIERLTDSSVLHGSEALCRLLRYLAEQYLQHPGAPVKEYQLATEVFGRPADFDPRVDSTVRVQTGRLRSKVAEYYASAGLADPIIIEIPKGSYSLNFHQRPAPKPAPAIPAALYEPSPAVLYAAARSRTRTAPLVWVLAAVSLISTSLLAVDMFRNRPVVSSPAHVKISESLRRFWMPFTDTNDRAWLIFSNAKFVGRPQDGIRYFDPDRDAGAPILDHYTGVGEVLAVAELTGVFSQLQHELRIKRGQLLSLDDVKNNDVIFIGSPAENLTLREIDTSKDFVFRKIIDGDRKGDTELVNIHPRKGEPALFRSTAHLPITEDYALIALVPGPNPSRFVLVLAGTTTMGTQAAAEFVTHNESAKTLMSQIPSRGGLPGPFEAVIHVRVRSGVPVDATLVALHAPAGH